MKNKKTSITLSLGRRLLFFFVLPLLATWIILFIAFYIVFGIDIVDGNSMNPDMHDRDLLFYRRIFIEPQPGDIVILDVPERGKRIVKRIVAGEGQTVWVDLEGYVTLDHIPLIEGYAKYGVAVRRYDTVFPLTVPPGQLFVLGDHRCISLDSRYKELGTARQEQVIGKVLYIFHLFE